MSTSGDLHLGRDSGSHPRGQFEHQQVDPTSRDAAGGVPEDARAQLRQAVTAVFDSWNSERARAYRRIEGIPDTLGTAVTVQLMVFGNLDGRSGSGVAVSRDPISGASTLTGDFMAGVQGTDVVGGGGRPAALSALNRLAPAVYAELLVHVRELERRRRAPQEVEFTVEAGKLHLLQARAAGLSAEAAVRAAVDMVDEGLIDETEAVRRVRPEQLRRLMRPVLDPAVRAEALTTGLPASSGAARSCSTPPRLGRGPGRGGR